MKRKGIIAVPLAMLLSVSALSVPAFAAASEKSITADTADQETDKEQVKDQTADKKQASDQNTATEQTSGQENTAEQAGGQKTSKGNASENAVSESGRPERGRKRGSRQEVAEPENAIGKDAAKQAALDDAKLSADQTGKVRSRVSALEDGTVVYKIHFSYDGKLYSYQIDATSGKVLDKSSKEITEEMANHSRKPARKPSGGSTTSEASDTSEKTDTSENSDASDASGASKAPSKTAKDTSSSST